MRTDDTLLRDSAAEAASLGRTPVAPPANLRTGTYCAISNYFAVPAHRLRRSTATDAASTTWLSVVRRELNLHMTRLRPSSPADPGV